MPLDSTDFLGLRLVSVAVSLHLSQPPTINHAYQWLQEDWDYTDRFSTPSKCSY